MLVRFRLYSVLKNLRFADPMLVLFLLDRHFSLTAIGAWLGAQHLLTTVLEFPMGVVADRFGRRSSLAASFLAYALSFVLLPMAVPGGWALGAGLAVFGVGEALRTGSHKAIMLDWLDQRGQADQAVEVVGLTRTWSRASSGFAAMTGGVLLWATQDWSVLYGLSAVAAVLGFGLLLSYPRSLEGEQSRERGSRAPLRERLRRLARGGVGLVGQSIVFESNVKLMRKFALQPFLKQGLALSGLPVVGTGALAIGAVELAGDLIGAAGARSAPRLRDTAGGIQPALRWAYRGGLAGMAVLALCSWMDWPWAIWVGVAAAVGVWALQNARRPVFVAAFGARIDKTQRATSLSLESLARTLVLSVLLPVSGALADAFGLWAAFTLAAGLMALGLLLRDRA